MSRLQEGKPFLLAALAALFALACFAFQPSDAMADPGNGLKIGNQNKIENMVANHYDRSLSTLNNAYPGPRGHRHGYAPPPPPPRVHVHVDTRPAYPPPPPPPPARVYVEPTPHYYVDDGGIGMTVSGAILSACGLALGAMAIWMPEAYDEWDTSGLTYEERIGVGITGGAVLVVGIALLGVGGYRIHQSKSVAIDVAPTYGGALMNMTF